MRLARELSAVLVIKFALLIIIKSIWFNAPTAPVNGAQRTSDHLLSSPRLTSDSHRQEEPK